MADKPRARGLYFSLRGLVATGIELLETRLELLSTEVQEEKARLLSLFLYAIGALILLAVGLIFLAVFFAVLLWETDRLLALGICAVLFLGVGALALTMALRLARAQPQFLAASLAELAQDRAALKRRE
ncbi:MAG: phage holin family protein [Rhodocyclaceae bacterium]|nr:phage holin family protein [Rhodocyclaceae bacterium]